MKKHEVFTAIVMAVVFCLLVVMVVQLFPLMREIAEHVGDESSIVAYVSSIGWRGVLALLGLSALQVIVPVIPALAIGILTGLSYGVYWGFLIILGGIVLGNLFVIISVRQLHGLITGRRQRDPQHKKSHLKEQLEKIKKPEIVAFFLFLVPFMSSLGPYLFAETRVSLDKYIVAVIAGNTPAIIVYVFLGDRISRGNYTAAIVIAALVAVGALFVLLFRKKIMGKIMSEGNA